MKTQAEASVSTAVASSPKLSLVLPYLAFMETRKEGFSAFYKMNTVKFSMFL